MIWDEAPSSYGADEIEKALSAATDVEAEPESLASVGEVLKRRGEAVRPEQLGTGVLLIADGLACDFMLTSGDGTERWGPLGPMMEFDRGVYPPPLNTFPDALRPYFEQRALRTPRADLRARYHDLVWLRWKDFGSARAALAAYLEASREADLDDATSAMTACDYLIRAAELSLALDIERDLTIQTIDREIRRGLPNEGAGYSCRLADAGASLLAGQPDRVRSLVEAMVTEADVSAEGRRHRERSLFKSAENLVRALGDADQARGLGIRQAESFESEARERASEGGLIELILLEDAAKLYGDSGAGPDLQRLKPILATASQRAVGDLHTIESLVSIPRSEIDAAASQLLAHLGTDEKLLLGAADALGFWPAPERVEEALDKAAAEHPLLFLVGHTALSGDGRYQPDPAGQEDRREVQLTRQFSQDTAARVAVTGSVIDVLRNEGHWSADRLKAAIRLVDEPLAAACDAGIDALESGRGWTAMHCLVPQLERAVRRVAVEIGANVMRRATGGGLRWASLEELLSDGAVAAALQPRLAVALARLFVDPYGPNYRNEIAHGLVEPDGDYFGPATLTALAILSVSVRLAIAREVRKQTMASADSAPSETADEPGDENADEARRGSR